MNIRKTIIAKGYSIVGYARSRGLDEHSLHKVLNGEQLGRRRGQARECIEALYRDGLLPEEHPMYGMLASQVKETA